MTLYDYTEHRHYVTAVTLRGEKRWDGSCFCGFHIDHLAASEAEAVRELSAHAADGSFSLVS
jgi:hypothetical protein